MSERERERDTVCMDNMSKFRNDCFIIWLVMASIILTGCPLHMLLRGSDVDADIYQ